MLCYACMYACRKGDQKCPKGKKESKKQKEEKRSMTSHPKNPSSSSSSSTRPHAHASVYASAKNPIQIQSNCFQSQSKANATNERTKRSPLFTRFVSCFYRRFHLIKALRHVVHCRGTKIVSQYFLERCGWKAFLYWEGGWKKKRKREIGKKLTLCKKLLRHALEFGA